jgi:hypothetical protein
MPKILQISGQVTLFGATCYPRSNSEAQAMGLDGGRNEEMRALTIAAFRVAQNNMQLSMRNMQGGLLLHLLAGSRSALNHWMTKGRLSSISDSYVLTPEGLAECQNTLLGLAGAYSTTEEKVQEWVTRLITGDRVATRARTFPSCAWPAQ